MGYLRGNISMECNVCGLCGITIVLPGCCLKKSTRLGLDDCTRPKATARAGGECFRNQNFTIF